MKKNVLLTILLLFLMVMNGILLFMVVNEPEKRHGPPRNFIADHLDFNEEQMAKFMEFDEDHHRRMRRIDDRFRRSKEMLFSKLGSDVSQKELDSLTELMGVLSQEREVEVFRYFNTIGKICDDKQKRKLKEIVSGALGRGRPGGRPPHDGPPPR